VPAMPYVYGEYGCDMRGGFGGWKTGYGGNADAYAHDLELAATFLARQPDCLGACIFTLGTVSFHWNDFDIRGEAAERLSRSAWPAHSPIAPKLFAPEQAQARAVAPVAAEEASKEFRSKNRARLRRGARVRPLAGYPAGPELLKRILADGFVPTSRDFTVRSGGVAYVARSATHVAAGEERVYYASKGQPDDVRYVLA